MSFPASIQNLKVELLINGTWTDISTDVYQRDQITITGGRPDEAGTVSPSRATLTLDNRNGNFSPRNTAGMYFPFIGRNTQIRISAAGTSSAAVAYSGFRFWGEVSSWPPKWDTTGTDVYVPIQAAGVLQRFAQSGSVGSAMRRHYSLMNTVPVAYWTCEDGTNASSLAANAPSGSDMTFIGTPTFASDTSFSGSDPLPLLNGSTWTGLTGSFAAPGDDIYTTPGSFTWIAPGGVTSVNAKAWGGGGGAGAASSFSGVGGGGGEFAQEAALVVVPGNSYTVTVGVGGVGAVLDPLNSTTGGDGADSSFTGGAISVIAHGGTGGQSQNPNGGGGVAGTGSINTVHHNGGAGGRSATAGPGTGGQGGGSSGGTAAAGNAGGATTTTTAGAAGVAVTGGGIGGVGGLGSAGGGSTAGHLPASGPGGGGGAAGGSGTGVLHNGGSGFAGKVELVYTPSTLPTIETATFLLAVPTSGATASAVLMRVLTTGTIAKVDVAINSTSTGLVITGFNSGGTQLFTSTLVTPINGVPLAVRAQLSNSGTSVAWALQTTVPGSGTLNSTTGTQATATVGSVTQVIANPSGTIMDTGLGHIAVQYAGAATLNTTVGKAANGNDGELAADRFTRLATESGIAFTLVGTNIDTPIMGPQRNLKLTELFQSIEDLDRGLLFETRDKLGLGYRTRVNLQNQTATFTLDYSAAALAGTLEPTDDDTHIRNDVTLTRYNGSSDNEVLTSGALSVLDPPNGVGRYSYPLTVHAQNDLQLPNAAKWVLSIGTLDQTRFPVVTVDLARAEVASIIDKLANLDVGDFFQISNPPAWLPSGTIKLLAYGYTETLNAYVFTISLNCVPENVYEVASLITGNASTFEGGIANWVAVTNCTVAQSALQAHTGTKSLAMTAVAAGTMKAASCSAANILTQGFPVTGGSFYVSGWFKTAVSSRSIEIGVDWYDSAGASISTGVADPHGDSTLSWTQSGTEIGSFLAPSNAAWVRIFAQVTSAGAASEVHFLDDVLMTGSW